MNTILSNTNKLMNFQSDDMLLTELGGRLCNYAMQSEAVHQYTKNNPSINVNEVFDVAQEELRFYIHGGHDLEIVFALEDTDTLWDRVSLELEKENSCEQEDIMRAVKNIATIDNVKQILIAEAFLSFVLDALDTSVKQVLKFNKAS